MKAGESREEMKRETMGYEPETLEDSDSPDLGKLKMELNNAIWMHAPPNITLGDADRAATAAWEIIMEAKDKR